jgi:alpha-galactosidase
MYLAALAKWVAIKWCLIFLAKMFGTISSTLLQLFFPGKSNNVNFFRIAKNLAFSSFSGNVEYLKWDMNRPLTEVYSMAAGSGEVWQAEISHRYVLGLYELQQRLITAFPNILFENCASGGGRFDLGMLYFSPQIWCSDNTDPLVRLKVQYGTSLAYPARTIGAHVATVPNHLTGNTARLRTRAAVAMSGTFGYELDISIQTSTDRLQYQRQCELYKAISPIIRWGDLYRLWDPFKVINMKMIKYLDD